ncbi:MAG TPA: Type 1 glutamine amidotransferase-like domain-containing protein, partial [Acidimicrobiales bacterium]
MTGLLALVGGGEWGNGCDFDRVLLEASGADEVVVLPSAAAYEHPDRVAATAAGWFESLGAKTRPVMAVDRRGAHDDVHVQAVRSAGFVYLSDGSPQHLRSVLMRSPLWEALVDAWHRGAVLAGSGAGAMVLCDPMVDSRGGAFTVGLGLIGQVGVVPRIDTWTEDKLHRTLQLAPAGLPVVGIDQRTALLLAPDGTWSTDGVGSVTVWRDGVEDTLA